MNADFVIAALFAGLAGLISCSTGGGDDTTGSGSGSGSGGEGGGGGTGSCTDDIATPGCGAGEDINGIDGGGPGSGEDIEAYDGAHASGSGDGGLGVCMGGMDCRPGAIRYCDDPAWEWSWSHCTELGHWSACEETTAPTGDGCEPDSYAPEICCPPLGLCCQDNPGGPFVDFGSGGCAAITCPPP